MLRVSYHSLCKVFGYVMRWCQQSAVRMAADANRGIRQSRPIGCRNVWTQWQNHLFTGTSTARSSTRSPSATPGKTQLRVNVVAPAPLTLIARHESGPDLHEHHPSCLIFWVHKLRHSRRVNCPWQMIALWIFNFCMLWASWHGEVGLGLRVFPSVRLQ